MQRAHDVYIGGTLLPITPSKISTKIKNKNEVISLINGDDLNLLNKAGLTEFTFEARIPNEEFPSVGNFIPPAEFLGILESLKVGDGKNQIPEDDEEDPRIFSFMIIRYTKGLENSVNEKCTLEDYEIVEDATEGTDLLVAITLKKYISIKTQKMKWEDIEGKMKAISEATAKPVAPEPGEVLYERAKQEAEAQEKADVEVTESLSEEVKVKKTLKVQATAYTADPKENGGYNVTARGNPLTAYKYIAVDPKVIPLGTKVYIPYFKDAPNKGIFIADDTGGAIKKNRIDVLLPDKKTAYNFGRRELEIQILE